MKNKVLLILADGMRPDAVQMLNNVQKDRIVNNSVVSYECKTVMPSVTLPCHMSLFHSVDPGRHGITTNLYMPQVRPVNGLVEVLSNAGKKCAFIYDWEELRDLSRPGNLFYSHFVSGTQKSYQNTAIENTEITINLMRTESPDFIFLYFGVTDMAGHDFGWMSKEYLNATDLVWNCIGKILENIPDSYCVIITADHGGHDRAHGSDIPEDINIPLIINDNRFSFKKLKDAKITDIAPTITKIIGVNADSGWEGKSLFD